MPGKSCPPPPATPPPSSPPPSPQLSCPWNLFFPKGSQSSVNLSLYLSLSLSCLGRYIYTQCSLSLSCLGRYIYTQCMSFSSAPANHIAKSRCPQKGYDLLYKINPYRSSSYNQCTRWVFASWFYYTVQFQFPPKMTWQRSERSKRTPSHFSAVFQSLSCKLYQCWSSWTVWLFYNLIVWYMCTLVTRPLSHC